MTELSLLERLFPADAKFRRQSDELDNNLGDEFLDRNFNLSIGPKLIMALLNYLSLEFFNKKI